MSRFPQRKTSKKKQIYHSLIYGFSEVDKMIYQPCKNAVYELLLLKKYSDCILSKIPKDLLLMICNILLDEKSSFLDNDYFQIHSRIMYNNPCEYYYGFEYGRIDNIFVDAPAVFNGSLQLSNAKPPQEVIDYYEKHFGGFGCESARPKHFALLQNVYTTHYACGYIMFGYSIKPEKFADEYDHPSLGVIDNECTFTDLSHVSKRDYIYFIGTIIACFDGIEDSEGAEVLAEKLKDKYVPPKNFISRDRILKILTDKYRFPLGQFEISHYPILTFIPTMCYCCT